MTLYVSEIHVRHILEVGAGTGAITKSLARRSRNGQTADIVEIIPKLASLLRRRFGQNQALTIHAIDILSFKTTVKYDVIISSLPLNVFIPEITLAVINRLVDLASDGGIISFFEYKILQKLGAYVLPRKKLEQFYESRALIDGFIARFKFDEAMVSMNIPPAVVHYLRIDKSSREQPKSVGT